MIFIHHIGFVALKAALVIVPFTLSDIDCCRWTPVLSAHEHNFTSHGWQSVSLGQLLRDVVVSVSCGGNGHQRGSKESNFHCVCGCVFSVVKIILIKSI